MIDADALYEAEQEALGRAAQMDLALATRLHRLAMEAEDTKEIVELARSYQRASRCLRQTIMLRARMRHERERHVLATTPTGRPARPFGFDEEPDESQIDPDELRIDGRTMDLQEAASRIVTAASPDMPRPERLDALDRIDAWIDREVEEHEDFGEQDLDDHVVDLCRAAGLPEALAHRFRDLPRAPRDDEGDLDRTYNFPARAPSPRRESG